MRSRYNVGQGRRTSSMAGTSASRGAGTAAGKRAEPRRVEGHERACRRDRALDRIERRRAEDLPAAPLGVHPRQTERTEAVTLSEARYVIEHRHDYPALTYHYALDVIEAAERQQSR